MVETIESLNEKLHGNISRRSPDRIWALGQSGLRRCHSLFRDAEADRVRFQKECKQVIGNLG